MEHTPAPWTGALFTVPGAPLAAPARAMRVRRWSLQVERGGVTLSSTTENYGQPIPLDRAYRRPTFGLAAAAVAGGIALLLAGATAGRAWSPGAPPTDTGMLVPAATPFLTPVLPRAAHARKLSRPPAAAALAATVATDSGTAPAGSLSREEAINRAVRTGEFQEWTGRDGVTGFAVPSVAEVSAAGACRTLAVLARQPDGTDQVSSSKVCSPVTPQD